MAMKITWQFMTLIVLLINYSSIHVFLDSKRSDTIANSRKRHNSTNFFFFSFFFISIFLTFLTQVLSIFKKYWKVFYTNYKCIRSLDACAGLTILELASPLLNRILPTTLRKAAWVLICCTHGDQKPKNIFSTCRYIHRACSRIPLRRFPNYETYFSTTPKH